MQQRVIELETRLAFQEDAIHELNAAVARQERIIDALQRRLAEMEERLQSLAEMGSVERGAEPPPPHY